MSHQLTSFPKIIANHYFFILLIIIAVSFLQCSSLSTTQIVNKCHCDITSSFCDFGCCCDNDCSTTISEACFYEKSSKYCPNTEFFYKVKEGLTENNSICYYYNSTNTIVSQKTMSTSQRKQYIALNSEVMPVSSTVSSGYKGYKLSSILSIGNKNTFSFVDSNGDCLTAAGSSTFSFKFGQNMKISCICNSCGTPLLFSELMGKTVSQFLDITSNTVTLPQVSDSTMTSLKINFILGTYGSQKIKYIDKITYSYKSDGSNIRTLYLNFIEPQNIQKEETSASFFPQIPLDMFYPIHMMS